MTRLSVPDSPVSSTKGFISQRNAVRQIWGGMQGRICVIHSACNPDRMIEKALANSLSQDSVLDGKSLREMDLNEDKIRAVIKKVMKYNTFLVEGDMIATDHVVSTLRLLYDPININVKNSWEIGDTTTKIQQNTEFINKLKKSNIVLICGPFGNLVTSIFLQKVGLSWLFDEKNSHSLRTHPEQNEEHSLKPEFSSQNTLLHDYGVFFKGRNPYNPSKRMYAIMGVHAYGTQGAAALVTNHKSANEVIATQVPNYLTKNKEQLDYITWVEVWRKQNLEFGKFTDPNLQYRIVYPTSPDYIPETYENPSQIFETQSRLRTSLLENTVFFGAHPGKLLVYSIVLSVTIILFFLLLQTNYRNAINVAALIVATFITIRTFLYLLSPSINQKDR